MEKTAQSAAGAPRRRRRRRGSGNGTPAAQGAQNNPGKETAKNAQPQAQPKAQRQAPARKESKEQPAPAGRGRHRATQAESASVQNANSRRSRGGTPPPAKEAPHAVKPAPQRAARPSRRAAEDNPGLELISRRPPKQKFANFEEYLNAHGGMTVPLPEDETPAAPSAASAQ